MSARGGRRFDRARLFAALVLLSAPVFAVLGGAIACDGMPSDCTARGNSTTYSGNAAYEATYSSSPTGNSGRNANASRAVGSLPNASLVMYDLDPSFDCVYQPETIRLNVDGCEFLGDVISVDGGDGDGGDGGTGYVTIEGDQTCTIPFENGPVSLNVTGGNLSLDGPSLFEVLPDAAGFESAGTALEIDGTFSQVLDGGAVTQGSVEWWFAGD